jgi:thioredoxin reductase (NADPH)
MRDAIVIGKGPAGISAAIYLKRAGIDVLVIGKGYGALENSDKIENYYGFEEPISGKELIEKGIKQAENLGIEVITDEVVSIEKYENFIVKTLDKSFEAKTVLLATGKSRVKIDIKGFEKFKGKGISFCAVCDGFFYRNKKVAVIGNGKYAANELSELMNFTKDIILFTNGQDLTTDNFPDDIEIVYDKISEIYGDDKIKGLIAGNTNFDVDGIFVALGTASASDFAMKMGVFTEKDSIIVDEDFMTNVEGFYAAGDAIGGFLQIAKAVSDGAHASKGMIKYIKKG